MFGPKYVQGCLFAFTLLTIISAVFDGAYLGNDDYGVIQTLTQWTTRDFSLFTVPMVLGSFILSLPQLLTWDYAFLHSLGPIGMLLRFVLSVTISIGFVWGFFSVLFPIMANFVLAILRGITGLVSRFLTGV